MDWEGWSPERQESLAGTKQHYKEAGRWRETQHEREFWFHVSLPKSMGDFTVVLPGEKGCIGQPEERRVRAYWRGVYGCPGTLCYTPDSWLEEVTNEEVHKGQWCPECKERECECADGAPPEGWPDEFDEVEE